MEFDISKFNVIKQGACVSVKESFPIGNGDLGANVWIDENEALNLLLSKTDSISESSRLLKVGLVKITFDRKLFSEDNEPESLLDLRDGTVTITDKRKTVSIKIAAFRNRPLYGVRVISDLPVVMKGEPVIWRTEKRTLEADPTSAYVNCPFQIQESADVLEDSCTWYHHNDWSYADYTKRNQHLPELKDYIKNRTFGASFAVAEGSLQSTMYISAGCEITLNPKTLTKSLRLAAEAAARADRFDEYVAENKAYWSEYFTNYYIDAYGTQDAEDVSRLYTHQKYMFGCVNQGKLPIKFNGSIFNVEGDPKLPLDFDLRMWGGDYWIQNTRMIYWDLLYSGDFDGVRVLFDFLYERIPVFRANAVARFGHDGLLLPETYTVNGTYREYDYGYGQEEYIEYGPTSRYVKNHFNGMLEYSWMMLQFLKYTGDRAYFERVCLPFIQGCLTFFRERFPVRGGKMFLDKVESLETWQNCSNDCPDIAGLWAVVNELERLGLPTVIDSSVIPEIPYEMKNGKRVIAPCEIYIDKQEENIESPELYPLFPFYLYHLKDGIPEVVQDTYDERNHQFNEGWSQDLIWAALLGRQEKCKELPENFRRKAEGYFFDAYFGPNFDGIPDQCHGSAASIALRMMLLQDKDGVVLKYPAWPTEWKVSYRLPVAGQTVEDSL